MKKILTTLALVLSTTSIAANTGEYISNIANAAGLAKKQTDVCGRLRDTDKGDLKDLYVTTYSYVSKNGQSSTQYNLDSVVYKYSKNAFWADEWEEGINILYPYGAYGSHTILVVVYKDEGDVNQSVCFSVFQNPVGKK